MSFLMLNAHTGVSCGGNGDLGYLLRHPAHTLMLLEILHSTKGSRCCVELD